MEQLEIFDRILLRLAKGEYEEEVKRARDDFFRLLKDLREDDPSFERLTLCFLNWYVFDRPMDGDRGTPLQVFSSESADEKEIETLSILAANIHSIFEVDGLMEGAITLKDLFTGELVPVTERRRIAGLDPGDILEARLLPVVDHLVFAPGAFVFHPHSARGFILHTIGKSRLKGIPTPFELIQRLQAWCFRFTDRFKHRVPADKVYGEITYPGLDTPK